MTSIPAFVVLAALSAGKSPDPNCARIDPELVHCPAVQAPRVTELRDGRVRLSLSVAADGSVISSTVISSSGHRAWVDAAQSAVTRWRYPAGASPRTRELSFDFRMDHR